MHVHFTYLNPRARRNKIVFLKERYYMCLSANYNLYV